MLPIPATLTYANKSPESLGLLPLVAVSPITPTTAEQAAWARLKSGVPYQAQVLEQAVRAHDEKEGQHNAKALSNSGLANNVLSRVQLQQANGENVQMWMMLPTGLTGKPLQLQFAGKPNQLNPQVKWQLDGEPTLKELTANPSTLSTISRLGLEDDGLANSSIQTSSAHAASVQLSDTAKTLNAWRESALFPSKTQTYEAREVVSLHPEKPQVLAQDLKHALQASGLFYESHLKNASLGTQSWQSLLQEPQNQAHFSPTSMVAQQLQVLEQQRFVWHGEVWPGQSMTWQVVDTHPHPYQAEETVSAMQSELSLDLPKLGEIKVQIGLVNGHLQIKMQAQETATLEKMQIAKMQLAMSMVDAGLKLEGLSMRVMEEYHAS